MEFLRSYLKILKISPGAYIFQRPFLRGLFLDGLIIWRGLSTEENLCFKIDWASLIVGSKFTVFALFNFVFEGNFPNTSPRGGLYLEGRFKGFLHYRFGGLIFGGAYIWRGLFSEFYNICLCVVTESSLSTSGIVHKAKRPSHVSSGCSIVEVKSNVKL